MVNIRRSRREVVFVNDGGGCKHYGYGLSAAEPAAASQKGDWLGGGVLVRRVRRERYILL